MNLALIAGAIHRREADMWLKRSFATLTVLVAVGFSASPALSASIFLTGHDPDFHATSSSPENPAGAQNINQVAIEFITDSTVNPFAVTGSKFIFVESTPIVVVPGGHKRGVNGIVASGYTLGVDFDLHSASTLSAALDLLGTVYSAIVVASDFGGILTQAELDILNARSDDIIDFLNDGGGLYAMAESNGGAGLTPDGGHFEFLPFVVSSTAFDQTETGITVTSFGASLGLTNADVNGNFSHNIFLGSFGLQIVDVDQFGNTLSLAGRGLIDPGSGLVVVEPTTLALLGIALAGLGFSRRKRAAN
jgi:hypothetical protein